MGGGVCAIGNMSDAPLSHGEHMTHQFTVQPARITVQFIVETAAPEGCVSCSAVGALSFNTTRGRVVAVATQQGRVDTGGGGTRARGACGRGVLGLDGKRRTTIWGITTRTSAGANFSGHSRLGGRWRRKGLLVSWRKPRVGGTCLNEHGRYTHQAENPASRCHCRPCGRFEVERE